jgi:tRNA1(Val) A37 N6-methylase TrmN6
VCNPPYSAQGAALLSEKEEKRIARHEGDLTPEDVAASAASILKFGGRFCVVYPSPRAFEMMSAMHKCNLAPKRICTVHATPGRAPKFVLIEAVKGGGSGLHWLEPLVLADENGNPSAEWKRIYGVEET